MKKQESPGFSRGEEVNHDPQLVDKVAQAIEDAHWHDDDYHRMARAALDAMPKPIGYAVRVNGDGYLVASRSAEDAKSWAEAGYRPGAATPVALVPIERP